MKDEAAFSTNQAPIRLESTLTVVLACGLLVQRHFLNLEAERLLLLVGQFSGHRSAFLQVEGNESVEKFLIRFVESFEGRWDRWSQGNSQLPIDARYSAR